MAKVAIFPGNWMFTVGKMNPVTAVDDSLPANHLLGVPRTCVPGANPDPGPEKPLEKVDLSHLPALSLSMKVWRVPQEFDDSRL